MTRPRLYLLEPAPPGSEWAPFAGARPLAELRAGAWRIRERWARLLGLEPVAVLSDATPEFADADSIPVRPIGGVAGPAVIAASWFAPLGRGLALERGTNRLTAGGLPTVSSGASLSTSSTTTTTAAPAPAPATATPVPQPPLCVLSVVNPFC